MKKINHCLSKFIQDHWIVAYFLAILFLAVVINFGMQIPVISFNPSLDAPMWLGFWGSYLGGAIGCLPALAALYDNRREARRQHEESETSRRLAAMPVIACEDSSSAFQAAMLDEFLKLSALVLLDSNKGLHDSFSADRPTQYAEKLKQLDRSYSWIIYLDFQNIGEGPALNVSLACLNVPQPGVISLASIGSNEHKAILVCLQMPSETDEYSQLQYDIGITFNDIFGNHYLQVQPLFCRKTQRALGNISVPELIENFL